MNALNRFNDLIPELQRFDDTRSLDDAETPPASWYTDPRFLELEKETIFRNNWLYACAIHELQQPGDFTTGSLLGRPFVLVRNEEGNISAFYNVCAHHATKVASGSGNTCELVCPYHGWTYNLEGKLKRMPLAGAIQDFKHKNLRLKPIPTHVWHGFVFVCFGDPPADFEQTTAHWEAGFKGPPMNNPRFVKRISYKINCNWKVFVDNFLDGGYHLPHMHKGLTSHLDFSSYHSKMSSLSAFQYCNASGQGNDPSGVDFKERVNGGAVYAWFHPNFMINRYGDWMDTNLVIPINERQCETIFDYYYDGDSSTDMLEKALKASDKVQQEDIEICHMVQEGLASGAFDKGVYAPRFEGPMHHFHKILAKDLMAGCTN